MDIWNIYKATIRRNCLGNYTQRDGLIYWQNRLFTTIITYWIPISFFALVPGVIMSIIGGVPGLAVVDVLAVSIVIIISFYKRLSILMRKILFIGVLYLLAVVLIYYLGTSGPGLLYLLGITIFIILIFPPEFGYWSVVINVLICILIYIAIQFQLLYTNTGPFTSIGSWIAVTANLVILSLTFSILLPKLFNGLQTTIDTQQGLENELQIQQGILEGSEKRFRLLVENSGDIIASFNAEGRFIYLSPAFERLTGYTPEELANVSFSTLINKELAKNSSQFSQDILLNPGILLPNIFPLKHKNGHTIWVEGTTINLLHDENIKAIISNYHDITQQKKDEEKIIRANRMYAFISAINQTVVHTYNKKNLFRNVCEIAVQIGQFSMVWIGNVHKSLNTISLIEECGIANEDLSIFNNIPLSENRPEHYILKNNTHFLSNDIQNDSMSLLKAYALRHGLNSCMMLPIRQHGEITTILYLYSKELRFFDDIEIRLLEEVAGDISFALDVFDKERLRKEEERRRKKSEVRLIEAQAIAKVGSWEVDMLHKTETWSDELYKIYAIDKDKGKLSRDIILSMSHPYDMPFVRSKIAHAFKTYEDVSFDYRFITKSNEIKYAYTEWRFQLDENQKLVRIYGIVQDITEKKEIEEKNRISEIRYQALFEQAPDGISISDNTGRLIAVNKSMCNLLGYSKEELNQLRIIDILFHEDLKVNPPKIQYLKPGEEIRYDRRLKRKDGTEVYVDLSGGTMDNGQHLVFVRNITEKRIAERQREFDRKNFYALINSTDDLMWSVDRNMDLITCNTAFEDLIQQITGKSVSEENAIIKTEFTKEQLDRYGAFFERAFAGEIFKEIDHLTAPFEIWSEISFYPIIQGDEIIGSACYSRNITALKTAEQERIKMTDDIILRNKNLEQFAYIVSHNLRAPVANISGIIYVMENMQLDKAQEKVMVTELSKSIKQLDEVILDLNHILQRKDGNLYQGREMIHFSEMVESIQLSISDVIAKEHFDIISDFSEVNEFMTTKSYLYSIFYNLISNSIKYRRTDVNSFIKIKSTITHDTTTLVFEDNGLGIDLQKKGDQVFGLYKRFHYHTEGKGMGLYMVKTQVEALGGQIFIESEVNKGTTFTIEFKKHMLF